ncbi:MAG TPA: RNA-binding protein [Puia sp.]|nr:RNA-binding protein [Puia sp.]
MNIYVSNLSFHTTDEDLKSMFGKFGEVSSAKIIMDKVSGRSRGFGFVEMSSENEGKEAMEALNNKEIEGRAINVSIAREKEERGGSGGGGYRGGSSGGGGGYRGGNSGGGGGNRRW